MWWLKAKTEIENELAEKAISAGTLSTTIQEEWIEVEGYKGVHKDMTAYGGFKYEIGKTYTMDGEDIKLCDNGFHFCLNQRDVYNYYPPSFDTRYFKVKGLVRKTDFDGYGGLYFYGSYRNDKIVAKEIILIKEIPMLEMDGAQAWLEEKCPFIKEMDSIPDTEEEYKAKVREICDRELSKSYSEAFRFFMLGNDYDYTTYTKMKILADEGVSPDMRAYILFMSKK
jgi:phage FluMu protein Com